MTRLRPPGALCLMLGCLALSSGCGKAGVETDPGDGTGGPETAPSTITFSGAAERGALVGSAGGDRLRAGNDEIRGGEGKDGLHGGPGGDVIEAQDRRSAGGDRRDEIFCGPGRDEVLMDADDDERPRDCEMAGVGSS